MGTPTSFNERAAQAIYQTLSKTSEPYEQHERCKILLMALNKNPNHEHARRDYAIVRRDFGEELLKRGKYKDAIIQLEESIAIQRADPHAHQYAGTAHAYLQHFKRAEFHFCSALSCARPQDNDESYIILQNNIQNIRESLGMNAISPTLSF